MTNETETGPENVGEDIKGTDTETPEIKDVPIPLGLVKAMMGGGKVHEIGVQGSVIEQTVSLIENYAKPEIVEIEEPGTGLSAFVELSRDRGVTPVDESIFDQFRTNPKRRLGTANMLSLDSFIEHVNRFRDDDTVVFADNNRSAPKLTAVLDYHEAGAENAPRFGDHRTHFNFPLSDEWKAWQAKNAEPMKMVDFAHFLEDRIIDVMPHGLINLTDDAKIYIDTLGNPNTDYAKKIADPAKLMELATGLQIFENSVVKEANKLASGESQIEFTTEHTDAAGQKLNIPQLFVLGIPVFKNGLPYQIIARLRYRKMGGQIVFFYELWRTDRVFDHAFDEAVERVREEVGRPVLIGHPEV